MNVSSSKEVSSAEPNIIDSITKTPQKYRIVSRAGQAKFIDEAKRQSQHNLAKKYNIPRTTLQYWMSRKEKLKGGIDPNVVDFFESPSGQAWLHQMIISIFMIFHQNGNSGIPDLHEFFEMTLISKFVGTSVAALQKTSKIIDEKIIEFGKEEFERLSQNMPHKTITGALDENFIMNEMTLILMEPVSGFILAEELEAKRDADTWDKVTQVALQGLKVTVAQLIGDEAGGLIKLANSKLRIMKGSDLFHVQQEITKGLTAPLARAVQQVKKKQEDLEKEKLERLQKFKEHLTVAGGMSDLSKRGVNACKRMLEIEKEEKNNQKEIEVAESRYKTAQEARRDISQAYHPFNLNSGERQSPEEVKAKLEKSYETLEIIAKEANCTEKQLKKLEKSKGLIGSMIEVLIFFFSFLAITIRSIGLDKEQATLFEQLVSIEYLKLCLQRAKKKTQKDIIRATLQKSENGLEKHPLWGEMNSAVQTVWRRKALDCAQVFQRSSSCVEGRNGQLSLKFHAFRRVNPRTLKVLTVLHNFFIRRMDGSTAAERFFEQKPRNLFIWLLDKIELPRPRKKHTRRPKADREKQVA